MSLDRLAPAIFVFLWSTGWVTAKYAVYYTGPLTFLCLRYLLAGCHIVGDLPVFLHSMA
ncbi:drug/metabolite transporter (DMT)-like permease [Agrobacterium sp. SORGH_AS 745]|nr:drug/metabolite transporter (DMT)-like permease [Agrobacterium sp. SORGH_AS_0745]